MRRIEICGGIAAGKTTLATLLAAGSSASLVREQFRENPFWASFCADPLTWVEEKNFCFLVQHTGGIKGVRAAELAICDYAVFQDLAYASLVPRSAHAALMRALYGHLYGALPTPALIVHLSCAPEVLLQRIRARARPEEAGITLEYLSTLNDAIHMLLDEYAGATPVHRVASDAIDFAKDAVVAAALRRELLARVAPVSL